MKDFWAEELQNRKKVNVIKVIILIVVLLIFISAIVCTIVYYYNLDFRKWCDENVWKKEIQEKDTKSIDLDVDDNTQVYAYEKYICVFRKKKLEFYNKVGTESGKIELDINEAIFTSAGRYMAICENKFYLICGKEKLYESEVEGNISQINVSKSGYVSIVISNTSYKSVVDVFDKTGNEVFKTNLVTSRVADVSISQDSKYLAIAEIDLSGILIKSSIQIVSIELAKTNPSQAIINKYEAPTDKMILNVEYQEQNKLICMYSDGIESYEEKTSAELIKFDDKKESFMTIELSNRVANTNIRIIDPNTKKEREYVTGSIAKSIKTSDNKMAINFGTELHLIDKNGILLKKYISDTEINNIVMTDAVVGIVYKDRIQIINF